MSSSFSSLRVSPFAFSSSGPSGASPLGIRTPRIGLDAQVAIFGGGGEEGRERRPKRFELGARASALPHLGKQVAHVGGLDISETPTAPDRQCVVGASLAGTRSLDVSENPRCAGQRRDSIRPSK